MDRVGLLKQGLAILRHSDGIMAEPIPESSTGATVRNRHPLQPEEAREVVAVFRAAGLRTELIREILRDLGFDLNHPSLTVLLAEAPEQSKDPV